MLKENLKISIVKDSSNAMLIDARQLHEQLQVFSKFTIWIDRRIQEFGFEEGVDFFPKMGKSKDGKYQGGRNRIDYDLTLDMAKELAMLERNEIGQRIRRYFIAVEKEAREMYEASRLIPKRIRKREINGRRLYPFAGVAKALGYSSGGSLYYRRKTYPNHFLRLDKVWHCTEEMANIMALARQVEVQRAKVREMQPVIPLDFGDTQLLMEGGCR